MCHFVFPLQDRKVTMNNNKSSKFTYIHQVFIVTFFLQLATTVWHSSYNFFCQNTYSAPEVDKKVRWSHLLLCYLQDITFSVTVLSQQRWKRCTGWNKHDFAVLLWTNKKVHWLRTVEVLQSALTKSPYAVLWRILPAAFVFIPPPRSSVSCGGTTSPSFLSSWTPCSLSCERTPTRSRFFTSTTTPACWISGGSWWTGYPAATVSVLLEFAADRSKSHFYCLI